MVGDVEGRLVGDLRQGGKRIGGERWRGWGGGRVEGV